MRKEATRRRAPKKVTNIQAFWVVLTAPATANPMGFGSDGCKIENRPIAKIHMLDSTSAVPIKIQEAFDLARSVLIAGQPPTMDASHHDIGEQFGRVGRHARIASASNVREPDQIAMPRIGIESSKSVPTPSDIARSRRRSASVIGEAAAAGRGTLFLAAQDRVCPRI